MQNQTASRDYLPCLQIPSGFRLIRQDVGYWVPEMGEIFRDQQLQCYGKLNLPHLWGAGGTPFVAYFGAPCAKKFLDRGAGFGGLGVYFHLACPNLMERKSVCRFSCFVFGPHNHQAFRKTAENFEGVLRRSAERCMARMCSLLAIILLRARCLQNLFTVKVPEILWMTKPCFA